MSDAFGQTPNTWDGEASDNLWGSALNWSLDSVPTNKHDVVIDIDAAIIFAVPPATINSLTISNSAAVSFTSSVSTRTLNIDNNGSTIGSGSTLTING